MGAYVNTSGFNAVKVFVFGAAVGVFVLEGYSALSRDSTKRWWLATSGPSYSCTADGKGQGEQPCRCTDCGMRPQAVKQDSGAENSR